MRTNLSGRIAAVLVGLEGLGLAALTVREIVAIVSGDTGSIESAIALAVLTLVGAAAVIAFAFAIWRDQSWGRSGGIVTQLLILAVAFGAATGAFADPTVALVLATPALIVLVLLVIAVRDAGRAARRRRDEEAGGQVPGA
jgi:ABC-type multidrug transport system fused ATPase/permease subunit